MTTKQLIEQLLSEGGAIVNSADCSELEIAYARAGGRFSGEGFVRRTKEWLALQKAKGAPPTVGTLEWEMNNLPTNDDNAEREKRAGFRAFDYTGAKCTNCGRNRVMNCNNGRHICEKCGWDADRNEYSEWSPIGA